MSEEARSRPGSNLRVLLWAPLGAGRHYWGPGTSAHRLYEFATADGTTVDLVHAFPDQAIEQCFASQVCLGNVTGGMRSQLAFLATSVRWLHQHARNYDVIHALSGYWYSLLPLALVSGNRPPVALKLTSSTGSPFLPATRGRRLRYLMSGQSALRQSIEGIIALDQTTRSSVENNGFRGEVRVIPNGINTRVFHPNRSSNGNASDLETTVLSVGGLMKRKRPDLLISAVALLNRNGRKCRLLLVGPEREDQFKAQLVRHAADHGILSHVEFVDHVSDQNQLADCYRSADIFALASSEEGMSNALLEAMACGTPIVASDIPSNRSVVSDGETGLLVAPTPDIFAAAIDGLLRDKDRRAAFSARGAQRAADCFGYEKVWSLHVDLFRSLMPS